MKFKFVISAIPVGYNGAGDYLDYIIKTHKGHVTLAASVSRLNKNGSIRKLFYGAHVLIIRLMARLLAKLNLVESVVFHHPQTLGYELVANLIASATTIDYWVLDTSFFCKQSYNCRDDKACFRCIRLFKPYPDCQYYPGVSVDKDYLRFIQEVIASTKKITFHVQTTGYHELLKYRYGDSIKVVHEKMIVPEFSQKMPRVTPNYNYEFGLHAKLINAKGFSYALALASKLKNARFFMPGNSPISTSSPTNVFYMSCYWSSGLGEELSKCKVILCPSIWTAPVEAAVIKSMLIGRPVGLISSQYNLSCEIPQDCFVPLTGIVESDSVLLKSLLNENYILEKIGAKGQQWASEYTNLKD